MFSGADVEVSRFGALRVEAFELPVDAGASF
jgi:hypothetical protein